MKRSTGDRKAQPEQTAGWDGLRNSQAQNFLEALKREEGAFYQSNCEEPGIAGLAKLVQEACPDHPQFENNNPYCDPSSKEGNPTWPKVEVQFVQTMKGSMTLVTELKTHHQTCKAAGGPLKIGPFPLAGDIAFIP